MKYYIPIRKFSLWNKFYMYVDVERYCADTLFAQECVHCHFIEEYGKPDSDVKVIFVRFPKSEEQQFLRELTTVLHSININADKVSPSCVHIPQVPKLETYCNLTELPTRVYFIKDRAVKSAKVEKEDSHYVATTKATLSKRSYNCSWFASKADADRMLRWLLSSTEEC